MKHILVLIAIGSITLTACKKDRTCTCTLTKTGTSTTTAALMVEVPLLGSVPVVDTSFSTPINEVQTYDKTILDVRKRTAKQNCVSYNEPYDETITNVAPPLQLTTNSKGERKYSCKLK